MYTAELPCFRSIRPEKGPSIETKPTRRNKTPQANILQNSKTPLSYIPSIFPYRTYTLFIFSYHIPSQPQPPNPPYPPPIIQTPTPSPPCPCPTSTPRTPSPYHTLPPYSDTTPNKFPPYPLIPSLLTSILAGRLNPFPGTAGNFPVGGGLACGSVRERAYSREEKRRGWASVEV